MQNDLAKEQFKQAVRQWASKLGVEIAWLGIRPMRAKWASCTSTGHLNFNAELLELDRAVWDYVIVHELLHFFVPNHGKLWKSLMRAHLGDYSASEAALKQWAAGRRRSFEES
ncbi:MAG: M48 family metallopeptidase [Kiritimatiellia bacterium]|jgi:predicted metal-dependent hydrolase